MTCRTIILKMSGKKLNYKAPNKFYLFPQFDWLFWKRLCHESDKKELDARKTTLVLFFDRTS